MNIFYLHEHPLVAAQYHCDKHVPKMILESAQMLSIVARTHGFDVGYNMSTTGAFSKHPCTLWVGKSRRHFDFLCELGDFLCDEFYIRFGSKEHKTRATIKEINVDEIREKIPDKGWTIPPQCMPEEYKGKDPVEAYRKYYQVEKAYFAKYAKGRNAPYWFKVEE
mgnify:CR=1 FL=1|jgi:hypothetical protein|tara:strand:- start:2493 stop:2987 length:495 start_codon:yes stop_codon:yes gene_type:complete